MATNYTENYQLPIWAADDAFLRTEFNDAHEKIEDALTALSEEKICIGSYVGDGTTGRIIQLPFTPKLVIVSGTEKTGNNYYGILTTAFGTYSHQLSGSSNNPIGNISLVENGFQITGDTHNDEGLEQRYIAVR